MSKVQFITGTDTGVGKTLVAAALALRHRRDGSSVTYFKPLQTGVAATEPGDAAFVREVAGIDTHEGQRFRAPLAPAIAAAEEGRDIDYEALLKTTRALARKHDVVLVEGAGGLLVPMARSSTQTDQTHLVADLVGDLAMALDVELVLVTRPTLGTLNHTALTVEAARSRGLPLRGLIVSDWPRDPGITERTNLDQLATMAPILGLLPHVPGLDTGRPGPIEIPALVQAWE